MDDIDLDAVTGGSFRTGLTAMIAGWKLGSKMYGHDHNLPYTNGWIGFNDAPLSKRWNAIKAVKGWLDAEEKAGAK